jgi:hypothetical protein
MAVRRSITRPSLALVVGLACLLLLACCGDDASTSAADLLIDSKELAHDCASAAETLGFAVPCPNRWFGEPDGAIGCADGTCTSEAISRRGLVPVFGLGAEDFPLHGADWPDNIPRHATIVAWSRETAPAMPCPGAIKLGTIDAGRSGDRPLYECPEEAPPTDHANAIKTHTGHLLMTLESSDSVAEISIHGSGRQQREVLAGIASSIEFVGP